MEIGPDIIIYGMQEYIPLNATNILELESNNNINEKFYEECIMNNLYEK